MLILPPLPRSQIGSIKTIINADESLVEEGDAVLQPNALDWVYAATAENLSLDGDRILVQAMDLPGNVTEQEQDV